MKKIAFLLITVCGLTFVAGAQSNKGSQQKSQESFQEFRNRIMNNYNDFRKTILDHYADFLNGEWHEYESLNGLKRDETPKPQEAPRVDLPAIPEFPANPKDKEHLPEKPSLADNTPTDKPQAKPEEKTTPSSPSVTGTKPETKPEKENPLVAQNKPEAKPETKPEVKPEPKPEVKPEPKPEVKPEPKPEVKPEPKPEAKPEPKPEAKPEPKPEVKPEPKPTSPSRPHTPATPSNPAPSSPSSGKGNFNFNFYEIPMAIADIQFSIANSLNSPSDFSTQWKNLEANKVADKMLPALKKSIKELGLNDYLAYKYIESYVNSKFPNVKESSRMALAHYLIVNLGYDARIAVTTKGTPLLLIPFKQTVYGKSYLSLNNKKYYIFPPEGYDVATIFSEKVMTCQLPTDVNTGNTFDLVLGELNIPMKPKKFDLEYGPVHLTGEMNENLIPILYKYPQMPIGDYAKSNIQPSLREDLTNQIKNQIGNMSGDEGVEALLHFTQNAFQYATDDDYHGFEKPYFLEETLFYPKNDCEDRAIFYTYFVHNALGRDAQLVSFPGHEAATVSLSEPKNGVSYRTNGKTYYISDPTYIGATSGMVMPSYINVQPEVDYTY